MANCITGFSISNWLTLGFSFAPRDIAWRFPLAFLIFFTLCIWAMCPFLPDSLRLLIRKGRYEEAKEVLAALQGHGATAESPDVRAQFDVIKDVLDREQMQSYTWWQLLTGRGPAGVLRRMVLGAWMQAMNQVSGINARKPIAERHPVRLRHLLTCIHRVSNDQREAVLFLGDLLTFYLSLIQSRATI